MDFSKSSKEGVRRVDDVHRDVDLLLRDEPEELQRVQEHRRFIEEIEEHPIEDAASRVRVFGVKDVDLNAILKKNVLNRSIFTVDELCEMFLAMTIEKMVKYQKKKRKMDFDMGWLLLLLIGAPAAIVILLVLLGGM